LVIFQNYQKKRSDNKKDIKKQKPREEWCKNAGNKKSNMRNYQEITKKTSKKNRTTKNKHPLRHVYDKLMDSIETKNNSKNEENNLST
jgi:hypothetical protein